MPGTFFTDAWNLFPSHSSQTVATPALMARSRWITPAPFRAAQAPSESALNSAGFKLLVLANAVRIGSGGPVYVAGLLRLEPRIAP